MARKARGFGLKKQVVHYIPTEGDRVEVGALFPLKSSTDYSPEEPDLRPYFRSGNNIPVTRATIPWPGVGMVVVDCLYKRVAQSDEKKNAG